MSSKVKKAECAECGTTLAKKQLVPFKGKLLCRNCLFKDEDPIQVVLVRSNWAPWGEEPVIPIGDLLCPQLPALRAEKAALPTINDDLAHK
jgi:hypothetical protein